MRCMLIGAMALGLWGAGCSTCEPRPLEAGETGLAARGAYEKPPGKVPERTHASRRQRLIAELRAAGINDARVLAAMGRVPRHEMVPDDVRDLAYVNAPLPIGHEQTISQPYIVALMTHLADLKRGEKVLEIGTGSGYQAAVLAELGAKVFSIELVEPLGRQARAVLDRLGYASAVRTRIGDGYRGWPEEAPFDAIVITAAPPEIPEPLKQQLALGGKLVVPVGELDQDLVVLQRTRSGFAQTTSIPVRFVPMVGEAQRQR